MTEHFDSTVAPQLVWLNGHAELAGHWMIQAETVRGEGRCHWVETMPGWARQVYRSMGLSTASGRESVVQRRAQKIVNEAHKRGVIPT